MVIRTVSDKPARPLLHSPAALMWALKITGWTQRKLALEVGIDPSKLSEMLHGKRHSDHALLLRLSVAIGCPVSVLYAKPQAVTDVSEQLTLDIGSAA